MALKHIHLDSFLSDKCKILPGSSIIVGVSGGPDSVALLHLLQASSLQLRLKCLYVDHNLRPFETEQEKECVMSHAKKLGIGYKAVSVHPLLLQKRQGLSLEESCRKLRYQELERYREECDADCVAVGHTSDDQAEEILLRLIRGAGLKGLSGMNWRNDTIIRPLLHTSKPEIIDFLDQNDLGYCQDSSNRDRSFLRNRIRLDLLPELSRNYNPSIRDTLLRTAKTLKHDEDYIDSETKRVFANCISQKEGRGPHSSKLRLLLKEFSTYHSSLQRRIIEKICWKLSSRPTYFHITRLCEIALRGKTGEELHLKGNIKVQKAENELFFFQGYTTRPATGTSGLPQLKQKKVQVLEKLYFREIGRQLDVKIMESRPATLSAGEIILDADKLLPPFIIRTHLPGEKFQPSGMEGRKKISRFFSDEKLPHHRRNSHPLLLDSEGVSAILGLRADQRCRADKHTSKFILLRWLEMNNHK